MWPYSWTHVGTPSHLGHMDQVAATMPSQAHAGAAQEAPNIGQWEGQDVPWVRPSSFTIKGGIPSSRRYLPTYLHASGVHGWAEHSARRAEDKENCSKWPKMRTLMVGANEAHARLGPECAIGLVSSHMCPTYLLDVAQLLRFWEWQGRQVSP